jgi:hypothetical protein
MSSPDSTNTNPNTTTYTTVAVSPARSGDRSTAAGTASA